jgi:hypothetical protein
VIKFRQNINCEVCGVRTAVHLQKCIPSLDPTYFKGTIMLCNICFSKGWGIKLPTKNRPYETYTTEELVYAEAERKAGSGVSE